VEINPHIEKAKKGDQVAFTYLLDSYWNEVYGFMLKRTENETDAEDITIETFSKAFDKITTYNPEYQFNTWLIAIAKNVHIDLLRKKKSSLFVEITDDEDQQAYNIADSSPSAEDELIKEQNLSQLLQLIKLAKTSLSRNYTNALLSRNELSRNCRTTSRTAEQCQDKTTSCQKIIGRTYTKKIVFIFI
jgi:RNA polymerase sigma-70 factor (ECF subfamily)